MGHRSLSLTDLCLLGQASTLDSRQKETLNPVTHLTVHGVNARLHVHIWGTRIGSRQRPAAHPDLIPPLLAKHRCLDHTSSGTNKFHRGGKALVSLRLEQRLC